MVGVAVLAASAAGLVLRGCLTEKIAGKNRRTLSHEEICLRERGVFAKRVAIWIFGLGSLLRGCLTEKIACARAFGDFPGRYVTALLRGCLTEKIAGKNRGTLSHEEICLRERGVFAKRVAIWIFGLGSLLRGCLTEKIAGKNSANPLTRGDLPQREGSFRQTGRNLDIWPRVVRARVRDKQARQSEPVKSATVVLPRTAIENCSINRPATSAGLTF
jgi:hypothetical protein